MERLKKRLSSGSFGKNGIEKKTTKSIIKNMFSNKSLATKQLNLIFIGYENSGKTEFIRGGLLPSKTGKPCKPHKVGETIFDVYKKNYDDLGISVQIFDTSAEYSEFCVEELAKHSAGIIAPIMIYNSDNFDSLSFQILVEKYFPIANFSENFFIISDKKIGENELSVENILRSYDKKNHYYYTDVDTHISILVKISEILSA